MFSKTRDLVLTIAAASALALSLTSCAPAATPPAEKPAASASADASADGDCAGVTVVVDTGDLEIADGPSGTVCVDTDATITGTDAIAEAGFETVGTTTYPDDVVCRVNGVPAEDTALTSTEGENHFETCADMPAAHAYWSIWVKPAGGEWDYATTSLPGLDLNPGDSVQLLFTLNGEPAAPVS